MGIDAKEKTARSTSVGADERQSIQKDSDNSIPASEAKGNGEMENLEEMYRKMQRMADPRYLHTLTMTELFQTAYKSRPPIIENLLHSGAYLLAGAPKIGKSFLVAQIAYHVSTGQALWDCKVHQGTVLYLALEDDFQRIQNRMFMMYGVNDNSEPTLCHRCRKNRKWPGRTAGKLHPRSPRYQAHHHRHHAENPGGRRRSVQLRQRL